MNAYVTLDGKKYPALADNWAPAMSKASTVRYTFAGATDVTYGPATPVGWEGTLVADVTSRGTGWGSVADLRTTLAKRQAVTFVDHYGTNHSVHITGIVKEMSRSRMWDAATNSIFFSVSLVKV